ncbi:MAG: hypothetical protein C0621_05090 [Desulfuromonas sp.]|nr:MAG: hypothetical protein C0621_05090 [Desulfuromonas sp.]
MQCQTVLPGTECTFWSKQGCTFSGNSCQTIVDECQGCERIVDGTIGQVCSVAPSPSRKWAAELCNFATHRKIEIQSIEAKVNPLKASKKAAAGKK